MSYLRSVGLHIVHVDMHFRTHFVLRSPCLELEAHLARLQLQQLVAAEVAEGVAGVDCEVSGPLAVPLDFGLAEADHVLEEDRVLSAAYSWTFFGTEPDVDVVGVFGVFEQSLQAYQYN